ncbi:MAG: hypothetical protein QW309_02685 [Zestosphaera sp.]
MVESGVDNRVSEEDPKKELSQLVKALREAVIELRETLGELGNPLTQAVTASNSEEVISASGKTEGDDVRESVPAEKEKPVPSLLEVRGAVKKAGVEGKHANMKNLVKFMRLVNLMLDKIDKDMLMYYITFMNKLKLVKNEELELLKAVIDLVDEARKRSLSVEEQIALFSVIAENFGFRDEVVDSELMTYVLKLIVSR